jgi:DNA-binding NarL/FixJ family response regulator
MPSTLALNLSAPKKAPALRKRMRTLVVDDSPTILHAICALLDHRKIVQVVGRAETGPEALDAVKDLRPELVLIDADMPGVSGLRTALVLSQISPMTEIILMSMDMSAQFRAACVGCGAYAVIYKPKFLSELVALLDEELAPDPEKLLRQATPRLPVAL